MPPLPSSVPPPRAAIHTPASNDSGDGWIVGETPCREWVADDARALISAPLAEATAALSTLPDGLLVGLLPYPAGTTGPAFDAATAAHLMLFARHRRLPELPGEGKPDTFSLTANFVPDWGREGYIRAVNRVKDYLSAGDAYQVNLAQRFVAEYRGNPWHAFRTLHSGSRAPYAAWLALADREVLSFSPEAFLEVTNGVVSTHPIKGTRPRSAQAGVDERNALDLSLNPKDRAENLMIVDLLRNDLGRVCSPGSVQVPSLFRLESFHNVHHMVSTVRGELLAGNGIGELLSACFPGGSVTGAPKRRAMEIIAELEPQPRDVYCGSIFWMTADGRFGSNILIRTFLAQGGKLYGWAGAGIVSDSTPEGEYQECMDKLSGFMSTFADIGK